MGGVNVIVVEQMKIPHSSESTSLGVDGGENTYEFE